MIDFDEEIEYDQDQAINYPAVVPTVNFMLQNTPELIAVADALCRHSGNYIIRVTAIRTLTMGTSLSTLKMGMY